MKKEGEIKWNMIKQKGNFEIDPSIDYSAAFDSVSHKFIDTTLQEAGASVKTRRLFRAILRCECGHESERNRRVNLVFRPLPNQTRRPASRHHVSCLLYLGT